MQRTFNFFYAFLLAVLGIGVTLMAEDITLTTYYPAPYGAYNELTTKGDTFLATTSGNKVGIGTTDPKNYQLFIKKPNMISRGVYLGDMDPTLTIQGYTTNFSVGALHYVALEDNNPVFYITNGGLGYFAGNVGIGTTSPQAKLDVWGTVAVNGTQGASGTFTTADAVPKTVTVTNGVITSIL